VCSLGRDNRRSGSTSGGHHARQTIAMRRADRVDQADRDSISIFENAVVRRDAARGSS
jgi:hypothetical protein